MFLKYLFFIWIFFCFFLKKTRKNIEMKEFFENDNKERKKILLNSKEILKKNSEEFKNNPFGRIGWNFPRK